MAVTLNNHQQEFVALMQRANWSAAETARQLHMSKGMISGYVNGEKTPPSKTLNHMRRAVLEYVTRVEDDEARRAVPAEIKRGESLEEAIEQLRFLEKSDPPAFEQLVRSIFLFSERARREGKTPNSKPVSFEEGVAAAVESVKRPGVIYGRSRKAASTSGKTSSQASNADEESST